jgi:hypothetical protein
MGDGFIGKFKCRKTLHDLLSLNWRQDFWAIHGLYLTRVAFKSILRIISIFSARIQTRVCKQDQKTDRQK